MTHRIHKIIVIEETQPSKCEFFGNMDELRSYGPNNENICFDCGMKNEKTTKKKFIELIDSAEQFPRQN